MNFNYVFSAIGWLGFTVSLIIIVLLQKCEKNNDITRQEISVTVIKNHYDSVPKLVPVIKYLPGEVIPVPVPANVDTQKILSAYFAKNLVKRVFGDSALRVVLDDTICQNKFLSPGSFSYQWLKPIKTIESTTSTVTITNNEPKRKINIIAGGHADFRHKYFYDWGPDIYLQTKRGHLYGIDYSIKNEVYSVKAAVNINEAFRNKNK
jgi:hypothetical protein